MSSHTSVSSNVVSSCPQTTPTTPDRILIRLHKSLTGALSHPSPPIVFMASINTQGIWASVPIHWTCDWTKERHWFSSNPNPVLAILVHTLDSFTLTSPYPPTLGYNS